MILAPGVIDLFILEIIPAVNCYLILCKTVLD